MAFDKTKAKKVNNVRLTFKNLFEVLKENRNIRNPLWDVSILVSVRGDLPAGKGSMEPQHNVIVAEFNMYRDYSTQGEIICDCKGSEERYNIYLNNKVLSWDLTIDDLHNHVWVDIELKA